MNCEKCKSKKATLFYADDSGVRHALCAACGAAAGRLGRLEFTSPPSDRHTLPESLLIPESDRLAVPPPSFPSPTDLTCPHCSTTLSQVVKEGRVGCPFCYEVMGDSLAIRPTALCRGARMPLSYRLSEEKRRAVAEYKRQLRAAVEEEKYELAATLRDKIREIGAT